MAVPEKARLTVTVCADTSDKEAVTVATPPSSAIGLPLRLKMTVGGRSSSVMVPVPLATARVALTGLERLTVNVSFASSRTSPLTTTAMVFVVSPGLKVRMVVGMAR